MGPHPPQRARKLGVLVSAAPDTDSFHHALGVVTAALESGCDVFAYCIDEAVKGVARPEVQALKGRGLKLYACAYGAHRHGVPVDDTAAFAGLTVVSDLIAGTDRFVSFN